MKLRLLVAVCTCLFILGTAVSNAALVSRLGGLAVYDTDLDVTWLSDADAAGAVANWGTANLWIANLTVGGFTDWRLPTALVPDAGCTDDVAGSNPSADAIGYNCTGGEMGHLFYNELSGTAGASISTSGDPDLALFSSFILTQPYYTGTSGTPFGSSTVYDFRFSIGVQGATGKDTGARVLAVRTGDVGAVPIPPAFWLFGSGLLGIIGVARRKYT